jgi:phosphoribosylaminoimidazole-succinocarboxamide synthase
MFTPTTKAEQGHDESITFERMEYLLGRQMAARVRDKSLELYVYAAAHAARRGLILADTKFEFGIIQGELHLVDEILTPDSSRYWDAAQYEPGQALPSFDKQYVRDYLESLDWNKEPPGPELPDEVVARTVELYQETWRRLTGQG